MKKQYRNPLVTVDIIIEIGTRIVLVERKYPPLGWALPGGFVDYGESFERNLGESTAIGLSRGLNAQWTDGGLMYSPPFK